MEKYNSFKELPKKITDHYHSLYLNTETKADVKEVIYNVTAYCKLTNESIRLLRTIVAREAHGFIRKKATELGCIWHDKTREG